MKKTGLIKALVIIGSLAFISASEAHAADLYVKTKPKAEKTEKKPLPEDVETAPLAEEPETDPLLAEIKQPCTDDDRKELDHINKGMERVIRNAEAGNGKEDEFVNFLKKPDNIKKMATLKIRCEMDLEQITATKDPAGTESDQPTPRAEKTP